MWVRGPLWVPPFSPKLCLVCENECHAVAHGAKADLRGLLPTAVRFLENGLSLQNIPHPVSELIRGIGLGQELVDAGRLNLGYLLSLLVTA